MSAEQDDVARQYPLTGIRVLDLSRVFAGPVAGRTLADLGADVVKVEPPEGDVTRLWGRKRGGLSSYFTQQNAGKRNISVDLNHPDGPRIVTEMAAAADVLIENFRPGVMKRFGLDWASLSQRNPRLIMLSISGFGQEGPESQRAAYASIVHGEMGVVARQPALGTPVPNDLSFSAADVLSGLHGIIGVLAALRLRDATGHGQHIDLAMVDAMAFSDDCVVFDLDGIQAERINGEVWDAVGGPVIIAGGFKWLWHTLSKTHAFADPAPSDADLETKVALRREFVSSYFLGVPDRTALIAALDAANLAWGNIRGGRDVFASPTIRHRASVVELDDRSGGTRTVFNSPYRFSHAASGVHAPASHRGEHNRSALDDWLDAEVVTRLAQSAAFKRDAQTDALR